MGSGGRGGGRGVDSLQIALTVPVYKFNSMVSTKSEIDFPCHITYPPPSSPLYYYLRPEGGSRQYISCNPCSLHHGFWHGTFAGVLATPPCSSAMLLPTLEVSKRQSCTGLGRCLHRIRSSDSKYKSRIIGLREQAGREPSPSAIWPRAPLHCMTPSVNLQNSICMYN